MRSHVCAVSNELHRERRQARMILMALLAAWLTCASAAPEERLTSLGVGRSPTASELSSRSISVAPDGTGLPVAAGSAREGKAVYDTQCAACHGVKGEGIGDYPPLVGGRKTLTTEQPLYTVGSYWPY
jgi:mono/diheme cytochrome c family protein